MLNSFILSFRLKNSYRVNSVIYTLKHTPIIKKLFSYSLYTSKGLKIFANIVSALIEFVSFFVWKLLYLVFFFAMMIPMFKDQSASFINIFVFLTLIGGFMNTYLFSPTIDKYYAIFLMKFDARKYTLSNYYYSLIKCFVGLIPFTFIFGLSFKVSLLVLILIPIYVVSIKNIFNAFSLHSYQKESKVKNENKFTPLIIGIAVVLLALAYGLPYFNIILINNLVFYIIFIITFILGLLSFRYIVKFEKYTKMCKDTIRKDELIPTESENSAKMYKSQISTGEIKNTSKEGYEYFNYIFNIRHRKMLTNATKNISIGLFIFFTIAIVVSIYFPKFSKDINDLLKNCLPYYLFVMYFINRGQKICQTMFMNCDRSMLTYRFYREKTAILSLFKERLKTLIKLNVIPGFIMALGSVILLMTTGGASTTVYIITFLSIIAMSIFFSVHYLVLYYLLQPYDVNLDIKNPAFMSICGVTYFICYGASQVQIPTLEFGICMCLFTIIYSLLSLYLAYKYAPTRFKLRV